MSLRIRTVHLRPRTPRLVAIGQFFRGTAGASRSDESSIRAETPREDPFFKAIDMFSILAYLSGFVIQTKLGRSCDHNQGPSELAILFFPIWY